VGEQATTPNAAWREARALLDSVKDYAIFLLDAQGYVMSWNPGAQLIKQYRAEEIMGSHFSRFYTEEDVAVGRPTQLLARALAHGRVEDEGWRVRKDGTRFWANVIITPVHGPDGAHVGFAKVTRDLTGRRALEHALAQSEERLRLMIASVHDYAIFLLDPDGRIASWNPGAHRIKGYRADEVIGSHFSRFYPEEDVAAGKPALELEIASTEGRLEEEGWRVRKDGGRFWASIVINAVRNEKGELLGFTKVTRDMTERREAQEALARRALQQAAVAELGILAVRARELQPVLDRAAEQVVQTLRTDACAVLELQPDGQTLLVRAGVGWMDGVVGQATVPVREGSPAGLALRAVEPVITELPAAEIAPGRLPEVPEHAVVTGMSVVIPVAGESRPYGVLATYSAQRTALSRDDLNFFRSIANVIATAIGRARAEEQVRSAVRAAEEERQRTARAQEAVRERDVFLSVAAHELRTPLTALQLKLQGLELLVRTELVETPHAAAAGGRVHDALRHTERLCDLVERLLDVSRIAAGRLEMERAPTDLAALVRDVVADLQHRGNPAQALIRLSASGATDGNWDRRRLEQVVLNLVSNAIKYGEGKPIDIGLEDRGAEVRLVIEDHGIGIATGDQSRIFDAFERAAPVQNFAGLGLGLYITRRIVEAHGGTIEVSSTPGEGATFVVTLPRQARAEQDEVPAVHLHQGER
jgi:PAS domain S-box-containing protein